MRAALPILVLTLAGLAPQAGAQAPAANASAPANAAPVPPPAVPAPSAASTPAAPASPVTPAPQSPPVAPGALAPPLTAQSQSEMLVGGAPLSDPNVALHIVEERQFRDRGRFEAVLFPAVPQINPLYAQHVGTAVELLYHLRNDFALQVTPIDNWYARNSPFNQELNNQISKEGSAADSLLLGYGGLLGVEVAPLYGKFALYDSVLARFTVVLSGGAGFTSSRHELAEGNPITYGDTGDRFLFGLGGGLRIFVGDRFSLRLEVRDLVTTARVDRVDGCNSNDLSNMVSAHNQGIPLNQVPVSGGCKVGNFQGIDSTGFNRDGNLLPAQQLLAEPSTDVLNNVGFYAGVGVDF